MVRTLERVLLLALIFLCSTLGITCMTLYYELSINDSTSLASEVVRLKEELASQSKEPQKISQIVQDSKQKEKRDCPLEDLFGLSDTAVKEISNEVGKWKKRLPNDYITPIEKRDSSRSWFQDIFVRLTRILYKTYMLPFDMNMGWTRSIYPMDREYLDQVFMKDAAKFMQERGAGDKCVEWGDQYMNGGTFKPLCKKPYSLVYDLGPCGGKAGEYEKKGFKDPRPFHGGAEEGFCGNVQDHEQMSKIPYDFFDIVICTQVFEHLDTPWTAIQNIYKMTAPGGYLVWSAPSMSIYHANPGDHFRYTVQGAKSIVEYGGFCVIKAVPCSNMVVSASWILGFGTPDFSNEEHLAVDPIAPHTVAVLAYKKKSPEEKCPDYIGVPMGVVADCWRGLYGDSEFCRGFENQYMYPQKAFYQIKPDDLRIGCDGNGVCDGKKLPP